MKTINKNVLILFIIIGVSCEDLTETPYTTYAESNLYQDEKSAGVALNGVYGTIQKVYNVQAENIGYGPTDELILFSWAQKSTDYQNLNFTASNSRIESHWGDSFLSINAANGFIDNMNKASFNSDKTTIMIGEAKFIRALNYFNLVRKFGEVPLLLHATTGSSDIYPSKAKVEEIYALVVQDLKEAIEVMPPANLISEQPRFSKGSAQGILAYVYATMAGYPLNKTEYWADVVSVCEDIVGEGVHELNPNYEDVFAGITNDEYDTEYNEHMTQIAFSVGSEGSRVASAGFGRWDLSVSKGGAWGNLKLTKKFVKSYDTLDNRYSWNINQDRTATKYKRNKSPTYHAFQNPLNWIIQRYSDVLLLYAEALNEVNKSPTQKAYDLINMIRLRARPADKKDDNTILPLHTNLSYTGFRDAIIQERSWELCYEGLRWYDLKRWGIYVTTIQNIAIGQDADAYLEASQNVEEKHLLFPIPQAELERNENLRPQNSGY